MATIVYVCLYVIVGCALYVRDRRDGKTYPAWLVIPAWPIPFIVLVLWVCCQPFVLLGLLERSKR